MTPNELIEKQHKYVLEQRALERILETEEFALILESANPRAKHNLIQAVCLHDLNAVKRLMRENSKSHLELLSYRELRKEASANGLKLYGTMTKGQLITRLEKTHAKANEQ